MSTYVHSWILLRMRNVSDEVLEKNQNNKLLFEKSYRLWENVEIYCAARQAIGDNAAHALWMPGN
jgi:hypothetical protein